MPDHSPSPPRTPRWSSLPLLLCGVGLVGLYVSHFIQPERSIRAEDFNLVLLVIAACFAAIYKSLLDANYRHFSALSDILTRLDRIAQALEKRPETASPPLAPAPVLADLTSVTIAITEGRWEAARAVLDDHQDHPDAPRLLAKLDTARQSTSADLLTQLEAAQQVADPARVLEVRDRLALVMDSEPLRTLDASLAKWFMPLIMKRLRTGSVGPDVAELAGQVAERFSQTLEGASLRASLPTLRRSAGLCPRCSKPYRGIGDACPACLAAPPLTSAPPDSDAEAEEVGKLTRPEESPFLDLDADR